MKNPLFRFMAGMLLLLQVGTPRLQSQSSAPKSTFQQMVDSDTGLQNIILFIGDGMGFEQVKAAGMYLNGSAGTLSFESFPYQGEVTTYSANSAITDSAASATAIATRYKVNNGVISMAYPGDGSELLTLLEFYQAKGRSTGLATTTYATHATPAAFGAHEPNRSNTSQIAQDYWTQTQPNLVLGGGANGITSTDAISAGYTVVTNTVGLLALDTDQESMVSGQFGTSHLPYEYDGLGALPHLSQMTSTALDVLDKDPDGFFLMVEGGRIDHAGHANHLERNIWETIEFANSVQVAVDWAQGREDTLILVTADHETGGLTVLQNNGQGNWPTVSWATTGHTAANVPIYAWGVNAQRVGGVMDNTDMYDVMTRVAITGLQVDSNSPTLIGAASLFAATITAGSQVSYTWSLGDSHLGTGATISHTYPAIGVYTAAVTASNSLGALSSTALVNIYGPTAAIQPLSSVISESATSIPLTISLDVAPLLTATVDYATADGSATASSDYLAISGTLTFSPGVTSHTLWLPVLDDTHVEPNETLAFGLSNPNNLALDQVSIMLILDDKDNYKSYLPIISQRYPPEHQVTGAIQVENGICCAGGLVGERITLAVNYTAAFTNDPISQMRASGFSGQCLSENDLSAVPWETFTQEQEIPIRHVAINWVIYYASVQYRDQNGLLSPVYCDDIFVEGMPPPPKSSVADISITRYNMHTREN